MIDGTKDLTAARSRVLLFAPRFAALVESGLKRQTIRCPGKRPFRRGDLLKLRAWEGKPYRSKQRRLAEVLCASAEPIRIDRDRRGVSAEIAGVNADKRAVAALALADGFSGVDDLLAWYSSVRSLPFEGVLIRW